MARVCEFHDYDGPAPCPHCVERGGLNLELAKKDNWRELPHCPSCLSPDRRLNEIADPPYFWCGGCGHHYETERRSAD
jgi:hypothetical protein